MTLKLLHLDDDPMMHIKTSISLSENPFDLKIIYEKARSTDEFFSLFKPDNYQCVLLDIMIDNNPECGIEVLKKIRYQGFVGAIIMLTTVAEARIIARCVEAGANDFVTKGLGEVELAYRITQAIKRPKLLQPSENEDFFAGETLRKIRLKLDRVLNSSLRSVLVYGESGTGKEAVGKLVQTLLGASKPFVSVNCGAIPEELIESEFFGHKKGAFTGAAGSKEGYFSQAHGGWLFLDEISNLSYSAQAALLRVLETGEMRAVGGTSSQNVDVRVLAATNVDLDEKVLRGGFRGDLLQRLRSYEIYLPPLRERSLTEQEEILDHLVARLNYSQNGLVVDSAKKKFVLTPETRKLFLESKWEKGNVREVWHTLQAASIDAEEGLITVSHLPKYLRMAFIDNDDGLVVVPKIDHREIAQDSSTPPGSAVLTVNPPAQLLEVGMSSSQTFEKLLTSLREDVPLQDVMDEVEKVVISAALTRHVNRSLVYNGLGISRSSLNQKKQKYNL